MGQQIKIPPPLRIPPSKKTQWYMQLLFDDCGFTTANRNAYLSAEFKRPINFLDDLSFAEASVVIEDLKFLKEDRK